FPAPIVAAIINNEIHELSFPIEIESPLSACHHGYGGRRAYLPALLVFLLETSFTELFPDGLLNIDHSVSSGGFYCQVTGRTMLSEKELDLLKAHMRKLIEEDHLFIRKEIPIQEAMEYFKKRGYEDKLRLLAHRQKDYLTMYSILGQMDYMHGYMVPSTGYLKWFDLRRINGLF
ncbi:MAG: nucleoside kinase, partial [Anaerolineales bacterium]|nr:nucleoside kinase [Anaerolineales bacterium]